MEEKKDNLKRSFHVTGMTCATCSRIVERNLGKLEEVQFAAVNLATETAFVLLREDIPMDVLENAVRNAGYDVSYESREDIDLRRYREARHNLLVSWIVTLPLMVLMAFHMAGRHIPYFLLMEFLGGIAVIFGAGRGSIKGAWIALSHFHANMDVLVVLGSLSAWVTSIFALAGMRVASFGAIGSMIIALHITGRFIESWLRDRASKEIRALVSMQAREARIINDGGEEMLIPIEAVKEGLVVVVRPGERIPVDGTVISGRSAVDESMISGESIPLEKGEDDPVTGGSLSLTGLLKVKVTKVGEDTFLAKMISLIQEAQGTKIPIQAFADRVTNYFVPAVFTLALLSGIFWFLRVDEMGPFLAGASKWLPWVTSAREPLSISLFAFVTTLVIACPCALGLATPMALITGTGAASKKGMIIRNAEAIQTVRDIRVVVMDKTGTITEGNPVVAEHDLEGKDLAAAASMERNSNHPLAKAIAAVSDEEVLFSSFEEHTGKGVSAMIEGNRYFLGKPVDPSLYDLHHSKGRTVVELRKNDVVAGFLAIEDPVREDGTQAVKRLKEEGIIPVMATGDNDVTAQAVAARVGIEKVYSQVRPEEKLDIVHRFQSEHGKVLMVGDGMNDAAALKGADIGVAIGSGTDLAIENADIIIVKGGVSKIAEAVGISRKTFRVIGQNLFWAFAYNVIAIPLAMGALLHPVIAEGAMTFSSVSVVLNSMRIKRS
jgi:Cu+-exporting ATPase